MNCHGRDSSSKFQEIKLPKSGPSFPHDTTVRVMLTSYTDRGKGVEKYSARALLNCSQPQKCINGHIITSRMKDSLIRKNIPVCQGKHWPRLLPVLWP
jgi:hypothetical protein